MEIRKFEKFRIWIKEHTASCTIVRCDLNLPSDTEDLSRIYAIKNTIEELLKMDLKIILISHYKRPSSEEAFTEKFSLKKIVDKISNVIGVEVNFISTNVFEIPSKSINSSLTLLENLRFYEEEEKNSQDFAKKLAEFADVYINEAFSVSHRKHASIDAITNFLPSFAGISFSNEIEQISKVTENIKRPYTAIIGGSKVSSKIEVLREISKKADYLIIAGAMANTFLTALRYNLGKSMIEEMYLDESLNIINSSRAEIILPTDFIASDDINTDGKYFGINEIPRNFSCFDIGTKSVEKIKSIIEKTKTLLWNGALGAFEFANFDNSSNEIAKYIAEMTKRGKLDSIIGGGETIASIKEYKKDMTFVSTAGGAFLEYIAGYSLPGITALT